MYLKSLSLNGFRNHFDREFLFDPKGAFLSGKNGSGKTNVVEALYHLAYAKSFRTMRASDVISWDAKEAEIKAVFQDDQDLENDLRIINKGVG